MTLFDGVFKVPAGYWVTIDHTGRGAAHRYWDNIPRPDEYLSTKDLSFDEAVSELVRLLRVSIRRRMVSDVPFGVLLSGGVDSSLNVALMSELINRPVTTFTVGYKNPASSTNLITHSSSQSATGRITTRRKSIPRRRWTSCRFLSSCRTNRSPTTCAFRSTFSRVSSGRAARRSCRWARGLTRTSWAIGGASTIGKRKLRSTIGSAKIAFTGSHYGQFFAGCSGK